MRWRIAWIAALALVGGLGCPHSFGRRGTIDKAVHKDVQEMLDSEKCTPEQLKLFCDEDPTDEECLEQCG